ncbi:MAG: polyprenyl synthetase family protein [Deltaproteobacteria bacterium]|nr:polyprenyl synthetase family protein [Deltaproteobacteria bacterium]
MTFVFTTGYSGFLMTEISVESICECIQEDLEKVEKSLQLILQSPVELVTQVASHIVNSGGKRLRPILCLLAARAFGFVSASCVRFACVCEFIHTATLLHDDVIDNATLRRGKESSNLLWGNKASVLVGDYLYCKASVLIAEEGDFRVLDIIAKTTETTTEGEVLEIIKSNDLDLKEEDYLEVVRCKTACLIAASCEIGAHLGGGSREDQERLRLYGLNIGYAFQLADDALDYISSNDDLGKLVGTDLKEGKVTLPLIHTLRHCSKEEKKVIVDCLETHSDQALAQVLKIIDKYQGIEYTRQQAQLFIERALEQISPLENHSAKRSLQNLAQYIIDRRN